ncbi:MAG: TauD/TfdA family dioxygenase [Kiloniellales bacterium]
MHLLPLHPGFGRKVLGCDLRAFDSAERFAELRALFEEHSLLLFPAQHLSDDEQLSLGRRFGPLEDRVEGRKEAEIAPVSNLDGEAVLEADDWRLKQLQSNFLWHTDSTFMPVPALANILQARVVSSQGGETQFASSRVGWRDLDPDLKEAIRGRKLWHAYAHSRRQIDPALAERAMFHRWEDQCWTAVIANPVNGQESLYIASHAYAVEGMERDAGAALIREILDAVTQPQAIYSHAWQPGDVLIWDERAILHRGQPWPFHEARHLASICVSLQDSDGLQAMRG